MENHTDHPLTFTVEQAAKLLGIGRSTADELVHTGDIPSLRLGRRIVVPRAKLTSMLGEEAAVHGEEPRTLPRLSERIQHDVDEQLLFELP